MKTETLEEYLKRGGKITKAETPEYAQGKTSRFKMKHLSEQYFIQRERNLARKFKRKPKS